jgi:restriction endonuclease Mrr
LLIGTLLAMAVWILTRVPPGLLLAGSTGVLAILLLLLIVRLVLRSRLTREEQRSWETQQTQTMHMETTARAIGSRAIELQDLAHLGNKEFEYFTGALLETMGVATELKCVGGAGDGGIDLRGKDRFNRLFIVQCKRLFGRKGGKVTPEQTRGFRGAMQRWGAGEAWFVTTSSFTTQAAAEVHDLTGVCRMVLIDGQKLITFIQEHWDALPAQWQWRLTECMVERDHQHTAQ